jgi:hypothetical protein
MFQLEAFNLQRCDFDSFKGAERNPHVVGGKQFIALQMTIALPRSSSLS